MKSESDVLSRLRKLKGRYQHKYLQQTQERIHTNCYYNHLHQPRKLARPVETEFELSPRRTNSLVVIQPASSVYICTYGANTPDWNGDICDDQNDAAPKCAWFKPKIHKDDAEAQFDALLRDDKYVLENYPDIAALQWVSGSRVFKRSLGIIDFIIYVLTLFSLRVAPKPKQLTQGVTSPDSVPESDLWDD
jgi:hypothetical protein